MDDRSSHIQGGVEWARHENFRNTIFIDQATHLTVANHLAGITAGELATGSFTNLGFDPFNTSDFGGLIETIDGLPNRSTFYGLYDGNGDGTITPAELGSRLTYATPHPGAGMNYDRTFQASIGPQTTRSEGWTFFAQDQIELGRLSLNVGLPRADAAQALQRELAGPGLVLVQPHARQYEL